MVSYSCSSSILIVGPEDYGNRALGFIGFRVMGYWYCGL